MSNTNTDYSAELDNLPPLPLQNEWRELLPSFYIAKELGEPSSGSSTDIVGEPSSGSSTDIVGEPSSGSWMNGELSSGEPSSDFWTPAEIDSSSEPWLSSSDLGSSIIDKSLLQTAEVPAFIPELVEPVTLQPLSYSDEEWLPGATKAIKKLENSVEDCMKDRQRLLANRRMARKRIKELENALSEIEGQDRTGLLQRQLRTARAKIGALQTELAQAAENEALLRQEEGKSWRELHTDEVRRCQEQVGSLKQARDAALNTALAGKRLVKTYAQERDDARRSLDKCDADVKRYHNEIVPSVVQQRNEVQQSFDKCDAEVKRYHNEIIPSVVQQRNEAQRQSEDYKTRLFKTTEKHTAEINAYRREAYAFRQSLDRTTEKLQGDLNAMRHTATACDASRERLKDQLAAQTEEAQRQNIKVNRTCSARLAALEAKLRLEVRPAVAKLTQDAVVHDRLIRNAVPREDLEPILRANPSLRRFADRAPTRKQLDALKTDPARWVLFTRP